MTERKKAICVFCSSSSKIEPHFFEMARTMGSLIGSNGFDLVYGGTNVGLMVNVAKNARKEGARVIGIIPRQFESKAIAETEIDELIVTPNMAERKARMVERADAFVVLPGGFGTLEELFEVMSLKIIGQHTHPIIILNYRGYYSALIDQFSTIYEERFAADYLASFYHIAATPTEVIACILNAS
ncbi:TIGR00730 family Rossman fold protein [candidate division KSB1 bacterium]|nr:TIGR00730 family Rossman fold protein [candidate division KSB1 bacterium]